MDTPYVVTLLAGGITSMAAAIGLVWRNGEDKAKRIEAVWQGRVEDRDKDNLWLRQRLDAVTLEVTALRTTFAQEAAEDRKVLQELREALAPRTRR